MYVKLMKGLLFFLCFFSPNKLIWLVHFQWLDWHPICFLLRSYNGSQLDETDCKVAATGRIKQLVKDLVNIAVFKVFKIGSNISCHCIDCRQVVFCFVFLQTGCTLHRNPGFYMHTMRHCAPNKRMCTASSVVN